MTLDDAALTILPYVAGCPVELIARELRNAAQEFCTETKWLTTGVQVEFTGAGAAVYDMEQITVDLFEARIDGEEIGVVRLNDPVVNDLADGQYVIQMTDADNLTLRPAATVDAPVTVDLLVAIAPGPEATLLHDDLWRRHHEALRDGALGRLYELPQRMWSNAQLAVYHLGKFATAKTKAKALTNRNRTTPALRLRVRPA